MERISWSSGLVITGMCIVWIMLGSLTLPSARAHDFLNLYTGASLALEGRFAELHDPAVQFVREREIAPNLQAVVPFVRPAFYAVWTALQCALLMACWTWAWRRFGSDALVFAALFLPAPLGIAAGQDCVMLLAVFIAAFVLAERGRTFASGMALGLLLWKFHLVLLWPVVLLVQRHWRMLGGFAAAAAAELVASVALGGWGV
ncbi:MAG: glycosyltransferase 87 family protein, partial [Acidobacteriota bacterium]